LIGRWWSVP